jgi:UDP-GlcNAc:undecaprenyl-phosphate GlcNAc-1-phosphate transferase
MLGLLAGAAVIVAVGIFDDIYQLGAKFKLVFQIMAALIVVASGIKIEVIYGYSALSPYISYPLTICWIVGITNAINLIDGLDGLAAGVSSIASLSLFFVSIIFKRWDVAMITAALAGSTLGFLPYNFNPAKIFMGDTGSTFLGFSLGVISIQGTLKSYTAIAIAIPLLVLGLPLFDTVFAVLRRLISGKSIMEADRGHLHHRLIDMGLSQRQSVVAMYTASGSLGLCAVVLAGRGVLSAIILILAVSVFIIGGARYMSEMDETSDDEEESNDENTISTEINNVKHEGIK